MTENYDLQLTGPYGVIPIALARELYTSGNYKQLVFTLYLDARRKCKNGKWEFSVADIARETGIDRRLVVKIAQAFVDAGILSSTGRTPKGSRKYQLKHCHFERYLNGKVQVKTQKELFIECIAPNAHQRQVTPINSRLPAKGISDTPKARCALSADLVSIPCTSGVHSTDTKISEKISEEDKTLFENPQPTKELVRVTASKEELAELRSKYLPSGTRKGDLSAKVTRPAPLSSTILELYQPSESSSAVTTIAPFGKCYTSSTSGLSLSSVNTTTAPLTNTITTTNQRIESVSVIHQAVEGKEVR